MNEGYFERPTDELRQVKHEILKYHYTAESFHPSREVVGFYYKVQRKWIVGEESGITRCSREVWRDLPIVMEEEAVK